jgi:hypothetical protein
MPWGFGHELRRWVGARRRIAAGQVGAPVRTCRRCQKSPRKRNTGWHQVRTGDAAARGWFWCSPWSPPRPRSSGWSPARQMGPAASGTGSQRPRGPSSRACIQPGPLLTTKEISWKNIVVEKPSVASRRFVAIDVAVSNSSVLLPAGDAPARVKRVLARQHRRPAQLRARKRSARERSTKGTSRRGRTVGCSEEATQRGHLAGSQKESRCAVSIRHRGKSSPLPLSQWKGGFYWNDTRFPSPSREEARGLAPARL